MGREDETKSLGLCLAEALLGDEGGEPHESPKEFMRRRKISKIKPEPDARVNNRDAVDVIQWPDYEDLEPWQQLAVQELQQETGLRFAHRPNQDEPQKIALESRGGQDWAIWENLEAAEAEARTRVRNDLEDEPDQLFSKDWLRHYIDLEHLKKELWSDEHTSHSDYLNDEYPDYEAKRDHLIKEGSLNEEDFFDENGEPLEIDGDRERAIDSAWETFVDQEVDKRLDDPLSYLEDIFGEEEAYKKAIEWGGIDIDRAVAGAIAADGYTHFLHTYDGDVTELPSGGIAARFN